MARGGKAAAVGQAPAVVTADQSPPAVVVEGDAPVRKINSQTLTQLGQQFSQLFTQYSADRRLTELKWVRNLRQYLGIYDPEVEKEIAGNRSKAYPRVTRIKCVSTLSRIMNLMHPGNERDWELNASPCPEMDPADVAQAVQDLAQERQGDGVPTPVTMEMLDYAVQRLADVRAEALTKLIDDQLQEIGGNQTLDIIALDRKVALSGILYGLGVLEGPYVREVKKSGWMMVVPGQNGEPAAPPPQPGQQQAPPQMTYRPVERTIRKPQYDFCPVWDFYPDMSGRALPGEGYFLRKVMGRSQVRKLGDREGFFKEQITKYLTNNSQGNYKPREFETDLRSMGNKAHVNDSVKQDPQSKYEIIIWKGPVSARKLEQCGVVIPEGKLADDIEAELWMLDDQVIRADMNPWRKLGMDGVKTVHCFSFDEDDTSPIGNGLPNVIRDSAMSVAAATRMTLDNASVTCGPNLEINTSLMAPGQDLDSIEAYKIWFRDDDGLSSQYPAVRKVEIDGHLQELQGLIKLFMDFADAESFVGPATGGDMQQMPSEPMRTAAGASMLRGEAALPFKDIIRNFDSYKQSMIEALVAFNKKFNPALAPEGDYNVIARGATSLIAKEVRGAQLDQLAQTLTPEERDHIDERKFVEARFAVRDMTSLMVPEEEAERKRQQREQSQAMMAQIAQRLQVAQERNLLSQAFKNITQGQKNTAASDATSTDTAISILEHGLPDGADNDSQDGSQSSGSGPGK